MKPGFVAAVIAFLGTVLLGACVAGPSGTSGTSVTVARAALVGGAPQIALQATEAILRTDPQNAEALQIKGDALTAMGQLGQAEWVYRAALLRAPHLVGAQIGLGRCLLAHDPAAAEIAFQAAADRDPRNAVALNDLGVARDLLRRHLDAQQAYRLALAADPDMIGAQVNLALSLAMSGDVEDAERLMRPYGADANASRKLRHDLAAVLAMGGQRAEAARILSADLGQRQVAQALADYAAARDAHSGLGPPAILP